MSYNTHQATSKDWLNANESIVFSLCIQRETDTLSLSGSSFDFHIIFDDFGSYLRGMTALENKEQFDDLKRDFLGWDILSDEALKKFESDL